MAKIRNVSSFELEVPGIGIVEIDAVAEVPDGRVYGFTCSDNWEPADKAAQGAHDKAEAGRA